MKTDIKCENDEFLIVPLKHVWCLMSLVNLPSSSKLCAINHGNGCKMRKREVLAMPLKIEARLMDHVNRPESQNYWQYPTKTHIKQEYDMFLGHFPQACIGSHEPCISPET